MSLPSTLFRTDVQRDVVRELVHAPAGSRSATDLARALHRPASSVSRAVRDLAADGLLSTTAHGRRQLLTPNYGNPAMRALREAVLLSEELDAERDRGVRWWQTMPELAAAVGQARGSGDEDRALRLLLDGVNQVPLLAALERLDDTLEPPGSTGDERWDALLAGTVRVHLRRLGRPAPRWTRLDPLATWWWPSGRGARAVLAMQRTPPELARLGIWFDARNLVTA